MSIARVHRELGWPSPSEILQPSGVGPRVYADLANRKIGDVLRRLGGGGRVHIGVLCADPADSSSQQPLAIICEFESAATSGVLQEAHRLAWNFTRAPLLITIEPHMVRAWTCCEPPANGISRTNDAEILEARLPLDNDGSLAAHAAQSLHWLELVTGRFFRRYEPRFKRDGCADRLLLQNLKHIRQTLLRQNLSDDVSHDLLARLIFIKFLFDRKDSSGKAALNVAKLHDLHQDGILSAPHESFSSILGNYTDTYSLFRWLDAIFNGDLFPGKGESADEREAEWAREKDQVKPEHLKTIADLLSGQLDVRSTQQLLWKEYSFDAIPLEFISSIYEEFVAKAAKKKSGAVYTPPHVVDFVLDEVLPWDSTEWNIRVLDPACGSGVFLVKAFQRLVHRWRLAHPGEDPDAASLRHILEENIFGVDIDPHAVRVASFSLYLAMCDEIDPKHYWTQVRFPRLRGKTLMWSDFFAEDKRGFRTEQDAGTVDVVVGNAPWGRNTVGDSNIARWQERGWPAAYGSIGPIFLAKAAALLKQGGRLSMLQPAGLILNHVGPSQTLRRTLFDEFAIETIVNLAPLRFALFPSAVGPACIVTFRNARPSEDQFIYICPKPASPIENEYRIVVEPYDVHFVQRRQAVDDAVWWTALMWGGRRDVALIKKLGNNVVLKSAAPGIKTRKGIIRGDEKRLVNGLLDRPILDLPEFPNGTWLKLDARILRKNTKPFIHSRDSTSFAAFETPQLIIKQSWTVQNARFGAAIIESDTNTGGVLCSQSYITVHVPPGSEDTLEAACLACNSILAVYFLFLTSSRLASYIPEPSAADWLEIPIPAPAPGLLDGLTSYADVDRRVFERLQLTTTDRILIKDAVEVTLADFKGGQDSPGRRPTRRAPSSAALESEPILESYCRQFIDVLQAAFGNDKQVRATIFQEAAGNELPVRCIVFCLNWPDEGGVVTESMPAGDLYNRLRNIGEGLAPGNTATEFQRIARVYDSILHEGQIIPAVYLIKPDCVRYWTCSAALRDADEVFADFLLFSDSQSPASGLEVRLAEAKDAR